MWAKIKRWWRSLKKSSRDDQARTVSDAHTTTPVWPRQGEDIPATEVDYRVWVPGAENVHETEGIKQKTRGEYMNGYPAGIIIHWDSGWTLDPKNYWNPFPALQRMTSSLEKMARKKALETMKLGVSNGYLYMVMDVLGNVYQSRPLTKWGYHAGQSYYKTLGYSVSDKLCGIEVKSPGKVTKKGNKFVTWFGQEFTEEFIRYSAGKDNVSEGHYVMFSKEQEIQLLDLCCKLWLHSPRLSGNRRVFRIDQILGHDSVAPGRKTDPGASLSFTIPEFQERVRNELIKLGYSKEELI